MEASAVELGHPMTKYILFTPPLCVFCLFHLLLLFSSSLVFTLAIKPIISSSCVRFRVS